MEHKKTKPSASEIVAKNVSACRFMLGLDYQTFAERAHITPNRVVEIEKCVNVLDNGIELLRISEACNIQYSELFEGEDGDSSLKATVRFPDVVYKNIYKMIRKYPSHTAFSKLIGVHSSSVGLWLSGKVKPGPFAFQNILTVLKLKACDLEAMVAKSSKPEPVVEDVQETVVAVAPKQEEPADELAVKVAKLMRLQNELPILVYTLDKMQEEILVLRSKLSELM